MVTIREYAESILNKKYELGQFDCIRMVIDFLSKHVDVPITFGEYTLSTYADAYDSNREKAMDDMVKWLDSYLTEVDYYDMRSGDILVLTYNFSHPFLGILIGNGKVLVITSDGVLSVYVKYYKVERVFRCQQYFQAFQRS